jgi:2-polyprenyl-3-methyl-5-hydroxy-6-metoxy-1,4-benzoquinol methylase
MKRMMQAIRRRLLGYECSRMRTQVDELEEAVSNLRGQVRRINAVLTAAASNPGVFWLFANHAERMDANVPILSRDRREFHLDRYRFAAAYADGRHVADIACGTGYGSALLANEGHAMHVTGVDIDAEATAYAESTYGNEVVAFFCASADQTGLGTEAFDLIASFETIEHVPDDLALLREMARLLKKGGQLVISTPNEWDCAGHPHHRRTYDRERFEKVLKERFEIEAMYNQNSGSAVASNHGQDRGITPTTPENQTLAECYIAVCRKR